MSRKTNSVIVRYHTPSHWKSLVLIENQISSDYEAQAWYQDSDTSGPLGDGTELLIISDHRGLTELNLNLIQKRITPLEVHLYLFGDFTLRLKQTSEALNILSKFHLKIFVASYSQKELVSLIFPEIKSMIEIKEYQIQDDFKFTEAGRTSFRKKIGVGPDTKLYGYAGRVAEQKGILELLKAFSKTSSGHLVIAGPLHPHPFWQFTDRVDPHFQNAFSKLLEVLGDKVTWIKDVPREEMSSFYSALDLFVSPSYFHDEDFNLTLSEALACERKCLVSRWGGHHRFEIDSRVQFLEMMETDSGFKVQDFALEEKNSAKRLKMNNVELDSAEKMMILEKPLFLESIDEKFNLDLYRKIYSTYL